MTTYNVYIEAVEHLFYSGNFEIEAETEQEAIEKASNEFYFDPSPYLDDSDGTIIETCYIQE